MIAAVKEGKWFAVRGDVKMDSFEHGLVMMVNDIDGREKPMRQDTAERKRIELHMHTNMSEMDAVSSASDLIKRAAQWGHPAVAITDHGVVQAFPEAFGAAKKNKIKLIPGMEGYLTDVTVVVKDGDDRPLTDDIVVVDFETTGLNPRKCRIMEIGAVRIRNGQVVEEYSRFVNPMEPIPEEVSNLTHITDAMVADANPAEIEIPKLLEFIGGAAFAAHNAKFDYSFLTEECSRLGIEIHMPVIDTLEFSRRMYPSLKSHRLGAVCKSLGISLKNAHRAVHDARATAHMLNRMLDTEKGRHPPERNQFRADGRRHRRFLSHHILLAAEQDGITNLNKIVSEGHLNYFSRKPHTPREILQKYRKGIIVGLAARRRNCSVRWWTAKTTRSSSGLRGSTTTSKFSRSATMRLCCARAWRKTKNSCAISTARSSGWARAGHSGLRDGRRAFSRSEGRKIPRDYSGGARL